MFPIDTFFEFKSKYLDKIESTGIDSLAMLFEIIGDYYSYMRGAYVTHRGCYENWIGQPKHSSDVMLDYQLVSSIFSIYTNGNICLDNLRIVNDVAEKNLKGDHLEAFNEYRKFHQGWAAEFGLKRDVVTAHPKDRKKLPEYHIQLGSWGTGGATFTTFHKNSGGIPARYKLDPYPDIKRMHEYINGLVKFYNIAFL